MALTTDQYRRLLADYETIRQYASSEDRNELIEQLIERIGDWITFPVSVWLVNETSNEGIPGGNTERKLKIEKFREDTSNKRGKMSEEYEQLAPIPLNPELSLSGRAINEGKTQINNHLNPQNQNTLFYHKEFAMKHRWKSVMIVPLIWETEWEREVIGSISMFSKDPAFFTTGDQLLTEKLARIAAFVILQQQRVLDLENLIKNTKKQVDRLNKIRNFSVSIRKKDTLQEKFHAIISAAVDLLEGSGGIVYRKIEGKNRIRWNASCGVLKDVPKDYEMDYGVGMAGRLMENDYEYLIENDFPISETFLFYKKELKVFEGKFHAVIEVPIIVSEKKIGVIAIVSNQDGRRFDSTEVTPLRLLSLIASFEITRSFSNNTNNNFDIAGIEIEKNIFSTFGQELKRILRADQIDVHLFREEKQLELVQIPEHKGYPFSRFYEDGPSLLRTVVENNSVLYIPDANKNKQVNKRLVEEYGHKTILGLPLVHDTMKIGAVFVVFTSYRKVSGDERAMLALLANEVSNVIYHLRLEENRQQFLRNIAHNILYPIMPLSGQIDLIKEYISNDYGKDKILSILSNMDHQLQLTRLTFRNFQDAYREGTLTLDIKQVFFVQLIEEIVNSLQPFARERRHIKITLENRGFSRNGISH